MLYQRLQELESEGQPIRIGLVGAGAFGRQIASRAANLVGMRIAVVADLDRRRAVAALVAGGIEAGQVLTADDDAEVASAVELGRPVATSSVASLIASDVDVVVEATGIAEAGVRHGHDAIMAGRHVVMVTVEADVLVGPTLKRLADDAGVIYSLAYGDEPALALELCDWARANGFEVVAAGKGTRFRPEFRKATPDDVERLYGFTGKDFNPQVFGSFLDGTKHAVEMAALSNASGLTPDVRGMHCAALELSEIPDALSPRTSGGVLEGSGVVEVVASEHPDGRSVARNLRGGVYAVFKADPAVINSLGSYGAIIGMVVGRRSQQALIYRAQHFVGHEVPFGIARMMVERRAVAAPIGHCSDVVAAAKRPLAPGTRLDGEGGYHAYGLIERADLAKSGGLVPAGLLRGAEVIRAVPEDHLITYDDVRLADTFASRLRAEQDALASWDRLRKIDPLET